MRTIAWMMDVDVAIEFYKRCIEANATTEKERVGILMDLALEGRMKSVSMSNKSKEEYIQDKAKNFKILGIRKEDGIQ